MISLFIPGVPVAQPRPRVTKRGVYTPDNGVVAWKHTIAQIATRAGMAGMFKSGASGRRIPVSLTVTFALPDDPTSKPDLDNLLKPVMDALTKVGVWHDDAQVVQVSARKCRATGDGLGAYLRVEQAV